MILDLTESERRILEEALSSELAELRIQIAVADRVDHRDLLKRRKKVITKVLDTLRSSPARRPTYGVQAKPAMRRRAVGGGNTPAHPAQ